MAKRVRLKDIADRIGVSTVTVSKALSGQKGMSEALRERIHTLAGEMGYVPSVSRKAEVGKKSYTIGLIISEHYMNDCSSFYSKLHQQVSHLAMEKGCYTMLEILSDGAQKEGTIPKLITDKKVEGLMIIGRLPEKYLKTIKLKTGIPMVYLDFCYHTGDEDAVVADSYNGAYCLTNYLYDMGHRHIAFVGNILSSGAVIDRFLGYRKSLLEHGITFEDEWLIPETDIKRGAVSETKCVSLPENMPTAFVCSSDVAAGVLISMLSEKGYKVPQDISIVSFDSYIYPRLGDIKLTTYVVDSYEMGRNAVHNLIRKISKERYRQGVLILEGHMVEGESVKKIG